MSHWHQKVSISIIFTIETLSKPWSCRRAREWARLGVVPLSWSLSNKQLGAVNFVKLLCTSPNHLLPRYQDSGPICSLVYSLVLPHVSGLHNLANVKKGILEWRHCQCMSYMSLNRLRACLFHKSHSSFNAYSMWCVRLVPHALPYDWSQLHPSNQRCCQVVDCAWFQKHCEWIGPAYSANPLARGYDALKEWWLLLKALSSM